MAGIFHTDGSPISETEMARLQSAAVAMGGDVTVIGGAGDRCAAVVATGRFGPGCAVHADAAEGPGVWAICDGRIDNPEDLGVALRAAGWKAHEAWELPAAEVVLAAYLLYGEECPSHLVGDYTFFIWDGRKQQLFAARDPQQMYPEYHTFGNGRFRFASDARLLLGEHLLGEGETPVDAGYDPVYMTTYMVYGNRNWERTPYAGVQQIPGGFQLRLSLSKGPDVQRWWRLGEAESLRYRSDEDYREHLRHVYRLAVGARMRGATGGGPIAIALSRGIDSASVACTALELLQEGRVSCPGGVVGITLTYPGYPESDESEDATAIARHLGLPHRIVPVRPAADDPPSLLGRTAEPNLSVLGLADFWERILAECGAIGSRVILSGSGGWVFTADRTYFATALRERRYGLLLRDAVRLGRDGFGPGYVLQSALRGLRNTRQIGDSGYARERYPWLRDPGLCQPSRAGEQHPALRFFYSAAVESAGHHLLGGAFRRIAGVESRSPLCDRRMIEFAWSLPIAKRLTTLRPPMNKPLQRRAFAPSIPVELAKTSAALGCAFGYARHRSGETLAAALPELDVELRPFLDPEVLAAHLPAILSSTNQVRWWNTQAMIEWMYGNRPAAMPSGGAVPISEERR